MYLSRALARRLGSRSATTKVVNDVRHDRGPYSRVTDADVHHFRSLLGESNVLTGARNLGPYNEDYFHQLSGKPPAAAVSDDDDLFSTCTGTSLPEVDVPSVRVRKGADTIMHCRTLFVNNLRKCDIPK